METYLVAVNSVDQEGKEGHLAHRLNCQLLVDITAVFGVIQLHPLITHLLTVTVGDLP